jgi:hypothetical protein
MANAKTLLRSGVGMFRLDSEAHLSDWHIACGCGAQSALLAQSIAFRRSLKLRSNALAAAPLLRIFLASSLRFGPNRSRAPAKASFTNSLLPITAPAAKYRTLQNSILAISRSLSTVSLSSLFGGGDPGGGGWFEPSGLAGFRGFDFTWHGFVMAGGVDEVAVTRMDVEVIRTSLRGIGIGQFTAHAAADLA